MDATKFFQSKGQYLNATHVAVGDLDLTIGNVELETMRDGEEKLVLYFQEFERGLPLNKTNGDTVVMAFGPETSDWIGGKITLYKANTKYNDEPREGVRVRIDPANYKSKRTPPTPPPRRVPNANMDDEIPFS